MKAPDCEILRKPPFCLAPGQAVWVHDTLAGLSATEKTGQLFCVMGGDYEPDTRRLG